MATIKKIGKSEKYIELENKSNEAKEKNDCSVKAVALVCGVSYEEAQKRLFELGRKPGRGLPTTTILRAVKSFGKSLQEVNRKSIICEYPAGHKDVLKNITTHHPARFHAAWKNGNTYIAFIRGHVLAIIDGVNHDHTVGSAKRIKSLYKVY